MLEYDEEIEMKYNSSYSRGFALGYKQGRLMKSFRILKILTEHFTDKQLKGVEPAEGDSVSLLKYLNDCDYNDLLDFYRKYESFNEKRLSERYIIESEYLPWRF